MDYKADVVEIGKRFESYLNSKGIKASEVADKCGMNRQNVYHFLRGARSITLETLVPIAMAANVSLNWLILGLGEPEQPNLGESPIVKLFKSGMLSDVPVEGGRKEILPVFSAWKFHDNYIALRIRGQVMGLRIPDHSIVIVDRGSQPKDREIGAFHLDGHTLIMYWREVKDGIRLQPSNRNFVEIRLTENELKDHEFEIIGEVVYSFSMHNLKLEIPWNAPFKGDTVDIDEHPLLMDEKDDEVSQFLEIAKGNKNLTPKQFKEILKILVDKND